MYVPWPTAAFAAALLDEIMWILCHATAAGLHMLLLLLLLLLLCLQYMCFAQYVVSSMDVAKTCKDVFAPACKLSQCLK